MSDLDDRELGELLAMLRDSDEHVDPSRLSGFSDATLLEVLHPLGDDRLVTNVPSFVAVREELRRRGLLPRDH
ncbi:MAG TPA: hypothetical protein VGV07_24635 [Devosia sp.]|jgi:hypothetical protein|uniref:hypothetical protein n=1 Tax=Devosia sp. TaxID=1871048 RepID=UPI002DDD3FE5|nr:hypothetical protein [Devosia sp.]HEV2518457.1 hypothetical protein [Devosia sp.]